MPTWGELLQELNDVQANFAEIAAQNPDVKLPSEADVVRRTYLQQLEQRTGRAVIIYATAWLEQKPGLGSDLLSIQLGDLQGFMEACSNTTDQRELDLFLHSPGGSAEAADAIMAYLRTQFDHIRAVVPLAAMSAATMMALACDEIIMGDHSQLGPIDPQFTISTPEGPRSAPGQAIIDQFALAKDECKEPTNIAAWLPILRSYAPGLLAMCSHQRALAEEFAAQSLEKYMLKDEDDPKKRAEDTAAWFADFQEFRSHGRRVGRDEVEAQGLTVIRLEEDGELQDAILSVHHAIQHTFTRTPSAKLVENHHGRAWIRRHQQQQVQLPQLQILPGPAPAAPQPAAQPAPKPPPPAGPQGPAAPA